MRCLFWTPVQQSRQKKLGVYIIFYTFAKNGSDVILVHFLQGLEKRCHQSKCKVIDDDSPKMR